MQPFEGRFHHHNFLLLLLLLHLGLDITAPLYGMSQGQVPWFHSDHILAFGARLGGVRILLDSIRDAWIENILVLSVPVAP